ncbi:Nucleolar protein 16 [Toensbergia leucococca]|nr:Nucleolar protein 16 [Toensbergia leucococca]
MGRELQKKKNKSSLPKAHQKPKSKKLNLRGNALIAANWSQSHTLSQNYRRLGLTSKLNARAGGTESHPSTNPSTKNTLSITTPTTKTLIPTSAPITRDPITNAIRIIRPLAPQTPTNPLNDPLNALSDTSDVETDTVVPRSEANGIIAKLEEQASMEAKKKPRQQSRREQEWIEALVGKWGEDFRGMVRDRKLNPWQQSEGDLRRRVGRWRGGGG